MPTAASDVAPKRFSTPLPGAGDPDLTIYLPEVAGTIAAVRVCGFDPGLATEVCPRIGREAQFLCNSQLSIEADARLENLAETLADLRTSLSNPTLDVDYTPVQATSDFHDFVASPGLQRGLIDLRWTYAGPPKRGTILVERSNNLMSWVPVAACELAYSTRTTSYACTDNSYRDRAAHAGSDLVSARQYYYRVCFPSTGATSCAGETSPLSATRAP